MHWLLLVAGWLLASPAGAHLMPSQQGTLNLLDNAAFMAVSLPVSALTEVDDNGDGKLSDLELQMHMPAIQHQVAQRLRIVDADQSGRLDLVQVMPVPDQHGSADADVRRHVLVLIKTSFAAAPKALRIETDFFGSGPGERQLTIKATRGADAEVAVLTPLRPQHVFFRAPLRRFIDDIVVGCEHILLGPDHLLFLLTVVVAAAGWRYWLAVLTSFTIAHSITLTLALFGWVRAPSAVIEPLIAASIVLMAILNLRQLNVAPSRHMALVFACGLLHGLGFASAIGEMGLPNSVRVANVLAFNVGIELGQALFLMALLTLGRALRLLKHTCALRQTASRLSIRSVASSLALLVGSFWLIERLGVGL